MAVNYNAAASLAGIFKEVYRGKSSVSDLVPNIALLANRIPFNNKELIGNKYHVPVRVAYEHSFTHSAAGTTPTFSAATYVNGIVEDAEVDGSQMIGIAAVDYEAIYKSKDQKAAFVQAAGEVIKNLAASAAKRREIQLLHGRKGWGTIESTSGATLTISAETWSNAIWAGMKGASLNAYANDGTTARTNVQADGVISSINMSTRTITLAANVHASWVAGDYVYPYSAYGSTEFLGLNGIATSTGTLFGVSGSSYETMQGNSIDTSTGLISMAKIVNAVAVLQSWGASGNILCILNPKAFGVLVSDQSSMRSFDRMDVGGNGKNGFKGLVFNVGGCSVELISHPMQKEGICTLFQEDEAMRIGATDLDFIRRGNNGEEMLSLEVSTAAASEIRLYSNQALFVEAPRHVGILSGLTY